MEISTVEYEDLQRKAKIYERIETMAHDLFFDKDVQIGDIPEIDEDEIDVLGIIGEQACLILGYYG
jgi:hypothetical protein